jgi:hypothetical protein
LNGLCEETMARPTVFVHTNDKQMIGAKVAVHALRRATRNGEAWDVRIIATDDFPFLAGHQGQSYLREGKQALWQNDDLQSFTPLRFAVPKLMGYQGRAVVIDPDVFAVGDIWELLCRDMGGKAIFCKQMPADGRKPLHYASSVMLLDCARLRHWDAERMFGDLFAGTRDYGRWMWLLDEPPGSIGLLEEEWNHFDTLTQRTKLLHNTHRRTQPWKTGLPADFTPRGMYTGSAARRWLYRIGVRALGQGGSQYGRYVRHPDPNQERLFFTLLRECLEAGSITRTELEAAIAGRHIRPDTFDLIDRAKAAA